MYQRHTAPTQAFSLGISVERCGNRGAQGRCLCGGTRRGRGLGYVLLYVERRKMGDPITDLKFFLSLAMIDIRLDADFRWRVSGAEAASTSDEAAK
jgi:hypothetical protein